MTQSENEKVARELLAIVDRCGNCANDHAYCKGPSDHILEVLDAKDRQRNESIQKAIEEIYSTGKYDFGNGTEINMMESGVFKEAVRELDDWRASAKRATEETCGDEKHCTCVGVLRQANKDLLSALDAIREKALTGHAHKDMTDIEIMADEAIRKASENRD